MRNFALVALGGGLGAVGRYLVSLIPVKASFPWLTLATNIVGSFLIGLIMGFLLSRDRFNEGVRLFWCVGICGGFTTFSTFSLETFKLFDSGKILYGGLYVVFSVLLCVVGVWLGRLISMSLFNH